MYQASHGLSAIAELLVNNLCIKLRSISGTGKVSVINFHILELPKVIKSRLKSSEELTSTTALGRLFQIVTIILV